VELPDLDFQWLTMGDSASRRRLLPDHHCSRLHADGSSCRSLRRMVWVTRPAQVGSLSFDTERAPALLCESLRVAVTRHQDAVETVGATVDIA
jgi:hypothetical protein